MFAIAAGIATVQSSMDPADLMGHHACLYFISVAKENTCQLKAKHFHFIFVKILCKLHAHVLVQL